MSLIYKYTLDVENVQIIEMPKGAVLLHVASVNDSICLWAQVDPEAPMVKRRFGLGGTGKGFIEHAGDGGYVGCAITMRGLHVWHVFDYGEV